MTTNGLPRNRHGPSDYAAAMDDQAPPPIIVLGRDTCDDTTRSRALLAQRGIPFTYLKVDEDPAADLWIRRLNDGGWRTPTILIGDPGQARHDPARAVGRGASHSTWPGLIVLLERGPRPRASGPRPRRPSTVRCRVGAPRGRGASNVSARRPWPSSWPRRSRPSPLRCSAGGGPSAGRRSAPRT